MSKLLFLIAFVSAAFIAPAEVLAQAQDVVEITVMGTSKKNTGSAARQEIFDRVVQETSVQYIKEILGEAKYEKNRDVIRNKIIKNSPKYVLFMKGGNPTPKGDVAEMEVTLKLSIKSLEALLLNEGLLYKLEGSPRALPMISVIDKVNSRSYSWWSAQTEEKSFLQTQAYYFNTKLREQLRPRGFYGLNPAFANYNVINPEAFQVESLPTEDLLFLGEYYQSQIVIRGDIVFKPAESSQSFVVEIKLVALHSGNGRVVGEVIRSFETDLGGFQKVVADKLAQVSEQVAQDLAVQLHDAWKSGTFGASLISLAVIGDLDFQQLNQFKKLLLTQVKDVKTLKERFFAPGRVTFELDSSVNPRQLADVIKAKSFPRFKLDVSEVRADGLDIKVNSL